MKANRLNCCLVLKIVALLIFLVLLKTYLIRFRVKPNEDHSELVLTTSVCDEVIKEEDFTPPVIYKGKPASVDFESWPEARLYYTAITEQAAEGPNFAGHYTVASWGCGTSCFDYAIVDSITGKIVWYESKPIENKSFSYDLSSNLMIFNKKTELDYLKGKTLAEIIEDDIWYARMGRDYIVLEEESDSEQPWLHMLCTENALDGIRAIDEN